jgi:hypothetical protein
MLHVHLSAQFLLLWGTIGGVITTHAAAIINQPRWPAWAKTIVPLAIALVVGLITAAASGRLDGVDWLSAATAVFAAAQLAYGTLFRGTAKALTRATSNSDGSFTITDAQPAAVDPVTAVPVAGDVPEQGPKLL